MEDLGRVVALAEWLREIDADYWMRRRKPPRHLEQVREEPAEGLAERWGGVPCDYLALIDFFNRPCEFAPENPDVAAMIMHNSFGIFLAEELLGTVIPLTETNDSRQFPQIISTRSAAEDLVYARVGSIPLAGNLAARTKLKLWMCGTEVRAALKTRRTNERVAAARNWSSPSNSSIFQRTEHYDQHNVVYAVGGDLGDQRALACPSPKPHPPLVSITWENRI